MSLSNARPPLGLAAQNGLRRLWNSHRFEFELLPATRSRQLLVDVSVIIQNDARTGIQRVVRAILGQLDAAALRDHSFLPVFATRDHGYCRANFASNGTVIATGNNAQSRQRVQPGAGDVFLGLDLAANILPHTEGEIASWRRKGVDINFVVYDLLPLTHPDWFRPTTVRNFTRWLGVLARQADRCICISNTVAQTLTAELLRRGLRKLPEICTIPLGVNLAASYPTPGLPSDVATLREWMATHRVVLSVGTIEPRKGHQCVLRAMTQRWHAFPDENVALLIVGQPGWKTEELQAEFRLHPEHGKRLLWLDDASDQLLGELYSQASGLIAASYGEGFGLPLLEALAHGAPVLARDLPVFREIGGHRFDYFMDDAPNALAKSIENWLSQSGRSNVETMKSLPLWSDSATVLLSRLKVDTAATLEGHRR